MDKTKCDWAYRSENELLYHDTEWAIPLHDDDKLFEMLCLEIMQAGLSWTTILNKREKMKLAFDSFDPQIIQHYHQEKIDDLLLNPDIVRNKLKVAAIVTNASAFIRIQKEFDSFNQFIWAYVQFKPIVNRPCRMDEVPSQTDLSKQITKDLKKRGFKFLGPTVVYAFMQSIGMVNDHLISCPSFKKATDSF